MVRVLGPAPGSLALVVGAGASGEAAALRLRSLGWEARVFDDRPREELGRRADRIESSGARFFDGGPPVEALSGALVVVASPGVPPRHPVLRRAREAGTPVWSELELGYRALGEPGDRLIAVTGTKGKSSTVTLLAAALRRAGFRATACGNIGAPLSAMAPPAGPRDLLVAETSSFQLATIARFRARVAVLLAVSEDHLDWHADASDYRRAKARIFENQKAGDRAVFDGGCAMSASLARRAAARSGAVPLAFGADDDEPGDPGEGGDRGERVVLAGNRVMRVEASGRRAAIADAGALRAPGRHQRRNLLAAAAVASLFDVPGPAIEAAAAAFGGMPHALEEVGSVAGVRFVNDSRATQLDATAAALDTLAAPGAPPRVRLILGGRWKAGSFRDLEPRLGPVAGIHAIGEAARRIADEIRSVPVTVEAGLGDAVAGAFAAAGPGGIVLLSPGCASFDMFPNYRERGERFRRLAAGLGAVEGGGPV